MSAVIAYLAFINVFSFLIIGLDKGAVYLNYARIPERKLILLALIGGSFGILFGMIFFRHKTKAKKLTVFIPSIACVKFIIALYGMYLLV